MYPAPCTRYPAPCTLHPAPCALNTFRTPRGGRSKISRWLTVGIDPCNGSTRTFDASPSTRDACTCAYSVSSNIFHTTRFFSSIRSGNVDYTNPRISPFHNMLCRITRNLLIEKPLHVRLEVSSLPWKCHTPWHWPCLQSLLVALVLRSFCSEFLLCVVLLFAVCRCDFFCSVSFVISTLRRWASPVPLPSENRISYWLQVVLSESQN